MAHRCRPQGSPCDGEPDSVTGRIGGGVVGTRIVLAKERHTMDRAERWYLAWVCTLSNLVQILTANHVPVCNARWRPGQTGDKDPGFLHCWIAGVFDFCTAIMPFAWIIAV